jgi:hypothetical protein
LDQKSHIGDIKSNKEGLMSSMSKVTYGTRGFVSRSGTPRNDALDFEGGSSNRNEPFQPGSLGVLPVDSLQIRALISERRRRERIFPTNLFSDPAWDMLLELYASSLEQQRTTTTNLCLSAAAPPTTALRWIGTLEQSGLVTKHGDPLDARRVFVALSATGKSMMERYFSGQP